MSLHLSFRTSNALLLVLYLLLSISTAFPIPSDSFSTTLAYASNPAKKIARSEASPGVVSDDHDTLSNISAALSSFLSFPFHYWILVLCTAGPCLALAGLTVFLKRTEEKTLAWQLEVEMQQSRMVNIAVDRAMEMEEERRQLAKLGIDLGRVRRLEPGIYVEDEEEESLDECDD